LPSLLIEPHRAVPPGIFTDHQTVIIERLP